MPVSIKVPAFIENQTIKEGGLGRLKIALDLRFGCRAGACF